MINKYFFLGWCKFITKLNKTIIRGRGDNKSIQELQLVFMEKKGRQQTTDKKG